MITTLEVSDIKIYMKSVNDDCGVTRTFNSGWEQYSLILWNKLSKNANLILDIGAYTGIYSILGSISNPSAKIYGFEINDDNLKRFEENVQINKCENIEALRIGISDKCGVSYYKKNQAAVKDGLSSGHHLISSQSPNKVEIKTIDNFLLNKTIGPNIIIKIDVEGTELSVLNGMTDLITKFKPTFIIEVFEHNLSILKMMINKYNYQVAYIDEEDKKLRDISTKQKNGSRNYLVFSNLDIENL